MEKDSAKAVRHVVKGMLPHNALGRQMLLKLKVYAGDQHPHAAQQPTDITNSFSLISGRCRVDMFEVSGLVRFSGQLQALNRGGI